MELRQLRYFVAVARRLHFTGAAEEIGVAQPALSQQIRLLERELGVTLLDRTGRRVHLTGAGAAFLTHAQRVLAEVAAAGAEMAEFAGLRRGRVTVGALPSLAERELPALLAGFYARFPDIELVMREENSEQLLALVEGAVVDLALVHLLDDGVAAAGIATEPLFTEELVAVVAPAHPLAGRTLIPLRELRGEAFILSKPGSVIRQTVLGACAAAGFVPRVAFESGGAATVRALAAEGLGVAILPRSAAEGDGAGVVAITLAGARLERTVALAWREGGHRSPAAAAFLAFARDYLRQHQHPHPPPDRPEGAAARGTSA